MSIRFKIYLVIEILTIILQGEKFLLFTISIWHFLINLTFFLWIDLDFICADVSSSSLGKNSFNSFSDHPKWNFVSNVTTQIGTHAYLPCKVRYMIQKNILSSKNGTWENIREKCHCDLWWRTFDVYKRSNSNSTSEEESQEK